MPIYEFYCSDCHRIFSFLSRAVNTRRRPACPRCGRARLERRASSFAISKGLAEPAGGPELPDMNPARLEAAMQSLSAEADRLDEDDPRQGAQLMRRLYEATGHELGPGMREALARMEAGEDPETIEEQLGDALGAEAEPGARPTSLAGLRRRLLPPTVDSRLYEM